MTRQQILTRLTDYGVKEVDLVIIYAILYKLK